MDIDNETKEISLICMSIHEISVQLETYVLRFYNVYDICSINVILYEYMKLPLILEFSFF